MNLRKKLMCILAASLVVMLLSACGLGEITMNEEIGNEPVQDEVADSGQKDKKPSEQLPPTKELELELEGKKEPKTAQLMSGNGYSIYVFDIFTFDSASSKLTMNVDSSFFVEIIKLPSEYKIDELRQQAEEELSELGEVKEEQEIMMKDADFILAATKDNLTKRIIVKEVDGNGYMFKLNVPHSEPVEGFSAHAYAMLNSIVNQ